MSFFYQAIYKKIKDDREENPNPYLRSGGYFMLRITRHFNKSPK